VTELHRCSSRFSLRGRPIVVTLIDPPHSPDGTELPLDALGVWEFRDNIDAPTEVTGFYCPARFTATGFGMSVEFTIRAGKSGVFVDHLEITSSDNSSQSSLTLPLNRLAEQAIIAGGRVGLQFPRGFSGEIPGLAGRVEVGVDEYFVVPMRAHALSPAERERINTGALANRQRKPKVNAVDDATLRKVAKAYKKAPHGSKQDAVREVLTHASESTVRDYIRRARLKGYLEDVPTTDRRRNRRKT